MKLHVYAGALACALAVLTPSCKKDDAGVDPIETPTGVTLGNGTTAGTKILLSASDTLRVGYNTVNIQVCDSTTGAVQKNVKVTVTPLMYMMSMTHSCPIEQPVDSVITGTVFPASMVFIMPGNSMEYWAMKVSFTDHGRGKSGTVEIPVTVVNSSRTVNFMSADSTKYFVTMKSTGTPKVGMNAVEFLVHKKQTMMMFPPVTDLTLDMVPDMPSMGHSSPGNVNPTHTSAGHYTGTVNYTMTGEWRLTLTVKKAGVTQGTAIFSVTL
jgi:hypothetical protein